MTEARRRRLCAVGSSRIVYGVMYIWHRGMKAVGWRIAGARDAAHRFLRQSAKPEYGPRSGTAVFLTRAQTATPPIVAWYVTPAAVCIGRSSPSPFHGPAGLCRRRRAHHAGRGLAGLSGAPRRVMASCNGRICLPWRRPSAPKTRGSISPMSSISSARKPWCRARTANPRRHAGRKRSSRRSNRNAAHLSDFLRSPAGGGRRNGPAN